jgi:hypothetical protein
MKVEIVFIPVDPSNPPEIPRAPGPPIETLWHYTTRQKLEQILASGGIQPSTAKLEPGEKPVVWFSSRPTWEPTATKCPLTGKLGQIVTAAAQGGLARIAVPAHTAPYAFPQLPLMAGTSPQACIGLLLAGLELGADPDHWHFSMQPVPRQLWKAIEVHDFEADRWHDAGLAPAAASPPSGSFQAPVTGHGTSGQAASPAPKSVLDLLDGARRSGRPDLGRPSLN